MEVHGPVEILTLNHHQINLTMSLVEDGCFRVVCPRYPEFEQVTLSKTQWEAENQFIDYFFACGDMIKQNQNQPLIPRL